MAVRSDAGSRVIIGKRTIAAGEPTFIIAEAGVNHDGDLAVALELVEAAADAGADAIKLQTFDPEQLVTVGAPAASYQHREGSGRDGQRAMLERLRLSAEDHANVAQHARDRGLVFLSTPFDDTSAEMLAELGVPAFKVGSGELTNLPFLEGLAAHSLPILLSTGMSELDEVRAAVHAVARYRAPLVLLHCTSSYPAPEDEANLRALDTLRREFGVPVGYSDHSPGLDVSLAAVAREACVLERHLTLDRGRPGPDHAMSLEPREFRELVTRVRSLERWLGNGEKRPQPSESELRVVARRGIVATRTMAAGDVLTEDTLAIKRPATGLPPARLTDLVGATLARPVAPDEPITEAHLQPRR